MPKSSKQAKARNQPVIGKNVKTNSNPSEYLNLYPSWRVSRLYFHDPYGWHVLAADKVREVQQKLISLESMTWNEILVRNEGRYHQVDISKLCKAAQSRPVEMSIDDIDEILSLRLTGRERVWGLLKGGVVELLWWDPEHEICPSLQSHT